MTPKKRTQRTPAEQQEILEAKINPTGAGEDAAIRDLLSDKFVKGPDTSALDVALALQQIIRGQDSLLAQVNEGNARMADELAKLRKRMSDYDKKAQDYENDRQKFLDEVSALADKVRVSGEAKDKLIAEGAHQFEKAIAKARAEGVSGRLKFEQELANMPRENVVSPGRLEIVSENGGPSMKLFPEVIRIKHRQWVLKPGVVTEVPKVVADVLRQRRSAEAEQAERKEALSAHMQDTKLAARWGEIDKKYGSVANDALPVGSTS